MPNPLNSTNLTLSEDTYNRLQNLKTKKGWTYNQTIDKLCEMEFKNNYIETVREYSLITETDLRIFKVTFKKESMLIEYYNPETGYDLKISNWGLDKKLTNQFFEFVNEEYARCMLEHLPVSIEFENFIIQRI